MHLFSTREALRDNTNYIYTTVLNLFRYVLGIPGASDTLMHLGLLHSPLGLSSPFRSSYTNLQLC